jgi:hypothetical protein
MPQDFIAPITGHARLWVAAYTKLISDEGVTPIERGVMDDDHYEDALCEQWCDMGCNNTLGRAVNVYERAKLKFDAKFGAELKANRTRS